MIESWSIYLFKTYVVTNFRVILIFVTIFIFTSYLLSRKSKIPGPFCLPLVGYLPFLGSNFHLKLTQLAKRYGPIYQIYLGNKKVIVVSDPILIKDAFRRNVFSGRPNTELTKMVQGYGIVNSNGALWKEQRAFLHWALREIGAKNCGPRRSILEDNIKEEVDKFLRILDQQRGKTCHIRSIVVRCVSNVVGSLLMSVKYQDEDSRFPRLLHLIEEGFRLLTIAIPVNFIPLLRYFPLCSYPYYKLMQNRKETESYFQEVANDHRKSLNIESARDFIDMYLIRLGKIKEEHKSSYFSEQQLLQILGDMFSAGLETVTTLLEWSVIYMVAYRNVQKLVQKEMDEKIGRKRLPVLADLPNLPYTEATLLEIMRRANVVAIGPAHATLQETELGGYKIPKGTHIVPNLWAVHMDPKLWPEPESFKPERFLKDGKIHVPSYFMPFSVGRRRCVGDTLTKMEMFMFLSCMLHQFDISIPEGEKPPELNGNVAASLTSAPYKVYVDLRDSLLL